MTKISLDEFVQEVRDHEGINFTIHKRDQLPALVPSYKEKYTTPVSDDMVMKYVAARISTILKPGTWSILDMSGKQIYTRHTKLGKLRNARRGRLGEESDFKNGLHVTVPAGEA